MAVDARRFGLDPALLRRTAPPLGLWPWHVPAARALIASQTQWRHIGGFGTAATGLDYGGVRDACAMAGIAMSDAVFADMQIMEIAAMTELNRRPA